MRRGHGKYGVAPKRERQADGRTFASKKEKRRYLDLKLLQQAKKIKNLECQPRFGLVVEGQEIGTYVADFAYFEDTGMRDGVRTWNWVVEDVKGVKTSVYKLKKKLMKAIYGIEIKEV